MLGKQVFKYEIKTKESDGKCNFPTYSRSRKGQTTLRQTLTRTLGHKALSELVTEISELANFFPDPQAIRGGLWLPVTHP